MWHQVNTLPAQAVAKAPGKAILLGEHFVVHGSSALAVALDIGVEARAERSDSNIISSVRENNVISAKIEDAEGFLAPAAFSLKQFLKDHSLSGVSVKITSEIPESAGLGSSAASSVSAISAVSNLFGIKLSKKKLYHYSMLAEQIVHGKPSGIDAFVSINGGLVYVRRKTKKVLPCRPFKLLVSYSGIQRNTGQMVSKVASFKEREPKSFRNLMRAINALVPDVIAGLRKGELPILAAAMNFNHEALRIVGASNEALDRMVRYAREVGFVGAKMTGAGGGGCIIALPKQEDEKEFENFKTIYPNSFLCNVPAEGVRCWLV
jgi:mevalonate kinase